MQPRNVNATTTWRRCQRMITAAAFTRDPAAPPTVSFSANTLPQMYDCQLAPRSVTGQAVCRRGAAVPQFIVGSQFAASQRARVPAFETITAHAPRTAVGRLRA